MCLYEMGNEGENGGENFPFGWAIYKCLIHVIPDSYLSTLSIY